MEEEKSQKNLPSLPPNYLSLLQLQERWLLKQQQQPQPQQDLHHKQQTKQENKDTRQNPNQTLNRNLHMTKPFVQNQPETCLRTIKTTKLGSSSSSKSRTEYIIVNEKHRTTSESKENKKKDKKLIRRNYRKPKRPEEENPSTNPPKKEEEKYSGLVEENTETKGDRSVFKQMGSMQKVEVVESVEIPRKCEGLSLNEGRGGSVRSTVGINEKHGTTSESKENKKKDKKPIRWNYRKPKSPEEENPSTNPPKKEEEKYSGLVEENTETKGDRSVFKQMGSMQKVEVVESVEIPRKCEGLSLNEGRGGSVRSTVGINEKHGTTSESKENKKKDKKPLRWNYRKPKIPEEENPSTNPTKKEEEKYSGLVEENTETKGDRSVFKQMGAIQKVEVVEIQRKCEGLSLNEGRGGSVRSTMGINGRNMGFGRRIMWKKREPVNLVWVKKGSLVVKVGGQEE